MNEIGDGEATADGSTDRSLLMGIADRIIDLGSKLDHRRLPETSGGRNQIIAANAFDY